MAKLVQLKQNGVEVFPRTVSNAVAVEAKNRLLSTVLTDVETEALGWSIEQTTPGSTLSYTLYKTTSEAGVTGKTAVSTFAIAQDIYLESVKYVKTSGDVPAGHTAPGNDFPYMLFVFNTDGGKQDVWVSVKDLVDVYTADGSGITETNGVFSIELDPNTGNILTKSVDGLLVTIAATGDTYVSAAIDGTDKNKVVVGANMGTVTYTAAAGDNPANLSGTSGLTDASQAATAIKSYVDAKVAEAESAVDSLNAVEDDTASGITVEVTQESGLVTNVAVTVDAITDSGMTGTLTGKLVEAQAIKDYVDAQIGGKDAGVSASTEDGFISITVEEVDGALTAAGITAVTQSVADASAQAQGLAEASDVKGYVDDQVSALSISATGDTYVNAAVDANDNKKINVSTNTTSVTFDGTDSSLTINGTGLVTNDGATAIKNYIDAKAGEIEAEIAALDADVSGETSDGYINVQVVEADGVITDVNVTDVVQAVATASSSAQGLAEASDVKDYVDGIVENLDANESDTEMGITVAVDQENGVVTGVTLTVDAITDSAATGSWAGKFVDAQTIKDYVDAKSAGVTILDTDDIDATATSAGTSLAINFANSGNTDATEGTSNAVFNPNQELAINGKQVYVWGVTAEDKGNITITWPGEETQNNEPEPEP